MTDSILGAARSLFSNPVYRRVAGLLFLFVAFVVWPQVFGVGPLSTTVATALVSADYSPSDGYLLLTANLFQGVSSSSEVIGVKISDASRSAYRVDIPETYLDARVTHSEFQYNYVYSNESIPDVKCFSARGEWDDVGLVIGDDDYAKAIKNAYDQIVSKYGDPDRIFGPGNYKLIVKSVWGEGKFLIFGNGRTYADVLLCGYIPDRYYLYSPSGSPELRTCFDLSLRTADGKTAAVSGDVCNDVGAGTLFRLTSNGTVVGTVTYNGWKKTYWPPDVATFPAAYLLVDRYVDNNTLVTGTYLVSPSVSSTLTKYRSSADAFKTLLQLARVNSCSYRTYSYVTDDLRKLGVSVPVVVYSVAGYSCDVSAVPDSSVWDTRYRALQADLKNLMSRPLSGAGFKYDAKLPRTITIIKDMTDYDRPLAAHEVTIRLNGKFVGVYYLRARPRILSVAPVGECTDTACTLSVRLKNDTDDPHEVGPVTVRVSGMYLSGQTVVSFTSPGEVRDVRIQMFPRGVTRSVTDTVEVTATAAHPVSPVVDKYSLSVSIEKAATCSIRAPQCGFDADRGLWYYVHCSSPYSSPEKVWCAEGQGCADGTGCVDDVLVSVKCLDSSTYEVQYQYAGVSTGVCEQGYVCDVNAAAALKVPPCVRRSVTPPPPPKEMQIHLSVVRPSLKDIALGMALVGIALLVMP